MYVSQGCPSRSCFNRYTLHYRKSFAFYILPFPTLISTSYKAPARTGVLAVGEWSGLPRSPFRTDSLFRLHLSPGSCVVSLHMPLLCRPTTVPFLAGANNCRRPVHCHEGYNDDSHKLAMQVLSLAPSDPCNSDPNRSCHQDQAPPLSSNNRKRPAETLSIELHTQTLAIRACRSSELTDTCQA